MWWMPEMKLMKWIVMKWIENKWDEMKLMNRNVLNARNEISEMNCNEMDWK